MTLRYPYLGSFLALPIPSKVGRRLHILHIQVPTITPNMHQNHHALN